MLYGPMMPPEDLREGLFMTGHHGGDELTVCGAAAGTYYWISVVGPACRGLGEIVSVGSREALPGRHATTWASSDLRRYGGP
jgi:hypothetical protein